MGIDQSITQAKASLSDAYRQLTLEIRAYPTPIAGCDEQYNHFLSYRNAVSEALQALERPQFVATSRRLESGDQVESR
ncbi:MAG: hypothetical protein OXC63_08530 [Aestuariivita sp.]|nr:hypothetical protein [Aestuariivita sp.]MCY4345436.1 hypothetical protein [Aestuariivita sp.]